MYIRNLSIAIAALALLVSVSIAGCGSSENSTSNQEDLNTEEVTQETAPQLPMSTPSPEIPEKPAPVLTDEDKSASEDIGEEISAPGTPSPVEIVIDTGGIEETSEPEQSPLPEDENTDIPDDTDSGLKWTFIEDDVDLGISGVSPEAILLSDGSVRLYVTDMGIVIYRADDGLHFEREGAPQLFGSDPTLIQLDDGSYRMYYVDAPQGNKEIWTAISKDGLNWTREANTGIRNTTGGPAWGVPDTVELPDGSVRIYWVDMPPTASMDGFEVIRSAIAENGTDFVEEEGYRTEDGYVDSYVLTAEEGKWIGLFATTPAPSRLPQEIYLGTSTDGLSWLIEDEPLITFNGGNAIDPTAVPLGENTYRVYYGTTPNHDPFGNFNIKSGVLTLEP